MEDLFNQFQRLLDDNGIVHFSAKEVFFLGASNERLKLNKIPDQKLWMKIIPTLKVIEQARDEVGAIRLLSIYRNAAYNKAISGAKYSQHMDFTAADCQPLEVSPSRLHKALQKLRNQGEFKGGLGLYPSFVHCDTRGNNADW